jgi:hypothetical protein
MKLTSINTIEDVKQFVRILMEEENLNFHPDTPFEDYVFADSGKPNYTATEAKLRDQRLRDCFAFGERNGLNVHELICNYGSELLFARLMPN